MKQDSLLLHKTSNTVCYAEPTRIPCLIAHTVLSMAWVAIVYTENKGRCAPYQTRENEPAMSVERHIIAADDAFV